MRFGRTNYFRFFLFYMSSDCFFLLCFPHINLFTLRLLFCLHYVIDCVLFISCAIHFTCVFLHKIASINNCILFFSFNNYSTSVNVNLSVMQCAAISNLCCWTTTVVPLVLSKALTIMMMPPVWKYDFSLSRATVNFGHPGLNVKEFE